MSRPGEGDPAARERRRRARLLERKRALGGLALWLLIVVAVLGTGVLRGIAREAPGWVGLAMVAAYLAVLALAGLGMAWWEDRGPEAAAQALPVEETGGVGRLDDMMNDQSR